MIAMFQYFFLQSMERICKGNYVKVDSLNTKCYKLIKDYQKVHITECCCYWSELNLIMIITNSDFLGYFQCIHKLNKYHILLPDCDITSPDCFVSNTFFLHLVTHIKGLEKITSFYDIPKNIKEVAFAVI